MFFSDLVCWPSYKDKTYRLDWAYVSSSSDPILFKILACPEREGDYIEVLSTINTYAEIYVPTAITSFVDDMHFKVAAYNSFTDKLEKISDCVISSLIPTRKDFLMYREMVRRTTLDISKYRGKRKGYLLREKKYGTKASNVNFILDEPIGEEDTFSYGRKYKHGFHAPIQMMCGYTPSEKGDKEAPAVTELGVSDIRAPIQIIKAAFPYARPLSDVWVNADTNDRYIIKISSISRFRGMPIMQTLVASLLPKTDPVYDIEINKQEGELAYA